MFYSKVITTIMSDKNFKEIGNFVFESKKHRAEMVFSRGPHCKEVKIFLASDAIKPILVIKELEELRKYFSMGNLDSNLEGLYEDA